MKTIILRCFNFLLLAFLSCLRISSSEQVMAMYGVPSGEFQVSGRVKNLKLNPIRNIEIEIQDLKNNSLGVTTTAKDGSFQFNYQGWPHSGIYLISRDIDGCRNGGYLSDTTHVKLVYPQQGWNQGKAKVDQNITLKYKSERKNRKYMQK